MRWAVHTDGRLHDGYMRWAALLDVRRHLLCGEAKKLVQRQMWILVRRDPVRDDRIHCRVGERATQPRELAEAELPLLLDREAQHLIEVDRVCNGV